MKTISDIAEWRCIRETLANKSIGLVHTMGNLHAGHLSLYKRSKAENDITVAVIFLNKAQFEGRDDDFSRYPRTVEEDKVHLVKENVDYLLLFNHQDMYPDGYQIQVIETTELSSTLEGALSPTYFHGVLTICLKFLNLIQPTRSYLGEKDYQQVLLYKKMVEMLFINTHVVPCPTVRADDGLALSSRNLRLNEGQRDKSRLIPEILMKTKTASEASELLENAGFKVDYVVDKWNRRLAAAWLGNTRLIDNIPLNN